ncbi:DUF2493 domain-containing protein (plasmid) [Sulfitobacter mediterraneus]|nr:DUF2493 domain-containing protein [Sulfitobacter mediterraneus]
MRDISADHFQAETGSNWMPRTGSKISHKGLTSAVIDSKNFLSAERRKKNEIHCPPGTRIAFSGGADFQDFDAIWSVLDQVHEKYPDMILLHGGTPKGAEHIASLWAANRGISQVTFKLDWAKHKNAAPFKRNDTLLDLGTAGTDFHQQRGQLLCTQSFEVGFVQGLFRHTQFLASGTSEGK